MSPRLVFLCAAAIASSLPLVWFSADPDAGEILLTMLRGQPHGAVSAFAQSALAQPVISKPSSPKIEQAGANRTALVAANVSTLALALPPVDLPLSTTLAQHKAMLAAGDGQAGCQLVVQLKFCRDEVNQQKESLRDYKATLDQVKGDDDGRKYLTNHIEFVTNTLRRAEAHCAGVAADEYTNIPQYALAAAQTGDLGAIRDFVSRPPANKINFLDDLEAWRQYKEWAPVLAEKAIAAGDVATTGFMAKQYAGRWLGSPAIVKRDARRAAGLYFLLQQTESPFLSSSLELKPLEDELGQKGVDEARAASVVLYQKTFAASIARNETPSYKTQSDCGAGKLQSIIWGLSF